MIIDSFFKYAEAYPLNYISGTVIADNPFQFFSHHVMTEQILF